jgi:DOPA 4,5-dioxygenase
MFNTYHAHIYYDSESRATAGRLRRQIQRNFRVEMGSWRDAPVGPHPRSMYQVAFKKTEFARIVPWLMANRSGLTVFVHPNSGDDYADHAIHAIWMGKMLRLRLAIFKSRKGGQPR